MRKFWENKENTLTPSANRTSAFAVKARHHNHCATGNWRGLQTHYIWFHLAWYKTFLHAIATHLLANNTFPALQTIKLDILPLPPLLFYTEFTKSKFPSWETVADFQMGVCSAARTWLFWVIVPGLLKWELAATTTLLETIVVWSKHIRLNFR